MFAEKRLREIEAAQQLLVLESDVHRQVIGLEVVTLRNRFAWLGSAGQFLPRSGNWLVPGAVIAGLLAARGWRSIGRWLPVALPLFRILRTMLAKRG